MKNELRKAFDAQMDALILAGEEPEVLVTVTRLPSGALEVQTNTSHLWDKLHYIAKSYDNRMCLINNPEVVITGFVIV